MKYIYMKLIEKRKQREELYKYFKKNRKDVTTLWEIVIKRKSLITI